VNNELIIDSTTTEVVIALLNDKRLIELHREKRNNNFSVGDIYLGRIKKVMPGLNAAFVDVGYEKDAFLHYLDLGPQFNSLMSYSKRIASGKQRESLLSHFTLEPDIDKGGKITQVLASNQHIMVQIAKEPISTKGPRISCEISLAGRYIVLVPFSDRVSVSQKIKGAEEKDRLKKLITAIKPKNFGVIIRTVAENQKVTEIEADMNDLIKKWDACFNELKTSAPPKKLLGEIDRTSSILRDILNPSFNSIVVNSEDMYEEIKSYLQTISPDKEKILKLHRGTDPFSNSAQIDFVINESAQVRLQILDELGQEVITLLDQSLAPGKYNETFERKNLPAGAYYCSLTVNGQKSVRMIVAK